MVAPFLGEGLGDGAVAPIAQALEDPQALDALETDTTHAVDNIRS
jgi:hypothetical protein